MVSQSSYGFKKLEKPHIFKKLDETIWFPKIWFLNQKMVSQNMVSQSKNGFPKYGFSIKKWFPKIWFLNQKMVSQNMVSQSKNGFPKYGSHLVVSISWFSIILWFPLNGFSIKKWFSKIWFPEIGKTIWFQEYFIPKIRFNALQS